MAAPKGNQYAKGLKNASHDKPWAGAIRRALLANDGKKLRSLAESLIRKAEEGDTSALKEIGDRLDGKPAQAVTGADGGDLVVKILRLGDGS